MKPSNIFSKYQCDDKLKIYSEVPLNNRQYKKMISNAKSRYMNDYYNTPRYNPKKDEKTFNNLLNSYYTDFNKLKKKYNFIEDEQDYEEEEEEQNNNVDYGEYNEKKNNLYSLFLFNNMSDIDEINFDLTDNLINNLNKGKNNTLLKNTQTQKDYDLRLKELIKLPNDDEEEEPNNSSKFPSKKNESEIFYLDNIEIIDENYLKLENNNSSELFEDIIKSNNGKEYQPPLYVISNSDNEDNNELQNYINMIKDNNYPLFEQLINPNYPTKYVPQSCFPRLPDEEIDNKSNEDNEDNYDNNNDNNNDNTKKEEDQEILREENKENENYSSRDKEGEKNNDGLKINNNDNNDNNFLLFDQIISPHYKNNKEYIPPDVFPKSEGEEDEDKDKTEEHINSDGDFEPVDDNNNKIENNMVENIINSNNTQKYSIPVYRTPDDNDKKEEKIEENNNQMKGNYVNLENYKDKEYPTVEKMINKDYNEDIKKEEENANENEEKNNKKLKESSNNNNERFESIPVDDLNDDKDDDDDYGGFD